MPGGTGDQSGQQNPRENLRENQQKSERESQRENQRAARHRAGHSFPPTVPAATAVGLSGRLTPALLVLVNLLPIGGVLFFGWDVAAIVVLYWAENLVIGFYNILRMLRVAGFSGLFPALFFLIHYGGFCAVHGLLLSSLLLDAAPAGDDDLSWPFFFVFLELLVNVMRDVLAQAPPAWVLGVLGLMISHGYSFVTNFLVGGEWQQATIPSLMSAPYKRIVVMHMAVIAGGMAVASLGEPLLLLLILVVLKTLMDVKLHLRERKRFSTPGG
jgi:hypothetical protein